MCKLILIKHLMSQGKQVVFWYDNKLFRAQSTDEGIIYGLNDDCILPVKNYLKYIHHIGCIVD